MFTKKTAVLEVEVVVPENWDTLSQEDKEVYLNNIKENRYILKIKLREG